MSARLAGPVRRFASAVALAASCAAPASAQDTGWTIERFDSRILIRPDAGIDVSEAIDVDFGSLRRRGIFRDLTVVFDFDATRRRRFPVDLDSVTAADGRPVPVRESTEGALHRIRIGDADRTVTGPQAYRLRYRVSQALNGFPDHDELYWNATGVWPVETTRAIVTVAAPAAAIERVACFEGPAGSTAPCEARFTPTEAVFTATRPIRPGGQLTVVVGLRKGVVSEPEPILAARSRAAAASAARRPLDAFFERTPLTLGLFGAGMALVVAGIGGLWWRVGRDRRYLTLRHVAGDDPREGRVPLFARDPVAVEFEPPDGLRPGQMGLLLDERADTLDVTATIVDLAVRGYLRITELPKGGVFGKKDWQLDRLRAPDAMLLEYERIVLEGLFDSATSRKLSDLRAKFHDDLARAKRALYRDGVKRRWFPRNPSSVRAAYAVAGVLLFGIGLGVTFILGGSRGWGLAGLPVVVGGFLLAVFARAMPRRTAVGRETLRRTLGFVKYMRTAETRQQAFAERAQIFTAYLPYAIAFRLVDRWARAFRDLDLRAATAGWYAGATGFDPGGFSSAMSSFSSSVSSAIASTPGGSGSSGFSGGSSGGGGGGGGGGSW